MMHGHEKSDSAIVAVKPANKVERSAAEPVAETKGNVGQQSTRRTQSRPGLKQCRVCELCMRVFCAFSSREQGNVELMFKTRQSVSRALS